MGASGDRPVAPRPAAPAPVPAAPAASAAAPGAARPPLRGLLEPAVWLSGRLSFSRKYLLIGIVMLLALLALSVPLWRTLGQDRAVAERERAGLREVLVRSELLATLVMLRDRAVEAPTMPSLTTLDEPMQALARSLEGGHNGKALATQLGDHWRQVAGLGKDARPPQRFAAFNGVINAVLATLQASGQAHRLNVDAELDLTFGALTVRLPQVLDTLGKQRGALALEAAEYAPFALSAQVLLTESLPALREAVAQLQAVSRESGALDDRLKQLIAGITAQQDVADKMQDDTQAGGELIAVAAQNQTLARSFVADLGRAADAHLRERIDSLQRSQWVLGSLLVGALAAIAYLFAGVYVSTLRSLKSLSAGTDAFIAGRLDSRIRIDTRDELVQVARNFNTMAGEFARLLGVIREQNESREQELARQVRARTAELAEKNVQLSAAALRVQEELALARDMQHALLPSDFPRGADWSVHACMEPARELGGDFYDAFPLPDGRLGLLVADVSGKGVAAAFFMAVSRTVLLDVAADGGAPHEVLARANDMLCARNPMELFITVCYVVFDPATGALEYASGGHPPPLVRREDGSVDVLPACHDIALAVMPEMRYRTLHASLRSGDTMVLFTDGVTEAFSPAGEAYGDDRLLDWLGATRPAIGPRAMVDALVADVHRFVADAEASDDLTCLILNREGVSAMGTIPQPVQMTGKTVLLDYSLQPTQLPQIEKLAQAVDQALSSRPDLAFSANLCLEELITNIITHGLKGQADHLIHIRLSLSVEWLEIVLKDDAPPFDPFGQAAEPDLDLDVDDRPIGGLGVHLVKTLMDDVRAYYDGSGNLIVLLKATQKKSDDA